MSPEIDKPKPPSLPLRVYAVKAYAILFACAVAVFVFWGLATGGMDMLLIILLSGHANFNMLVVVWGLIGTAFANFQFIKRLQATYFVDTEAHNFLFALKTILLVIANITFVGLAYWAFSGIK